MDRDVIVTIPALVFVKKTEDVTEFVDDHPFLLLPPKRRDVDLRPLAFLFPTRLVLSRRSHRL